MHRPALGIKPVPAASSIPRMLRIVDPPPSPHRYAGPMTTTPGGKATSGFARSARGILTQSAIALLALTALTVAIIGLVRSGPAHNTQPAVGAAASGDTTEADRALCTAVAPLLAEESRINKAYLDLGDSGTPASDAATPQFIIDVSDWVSAVQPVVNEHPNADPFLQRSLQRFIDDLNLIVLDLKPGPWPQYIKTLWSDSVGAYSGPFHVCYRLGVTW